MSLGRDWGFDSLSRAELLLRVERAFSVTLPTQPLQQAETLRDVLAALDRAATPREAVSARFEPISRTQAEPAPAEAAILTEVLDWHVSKHSNRTHVVLAQGDGQDVALSYEALARRSRAVAGGLRQRGVETGDRVAIMLPTSLEFFQAFFGALYACAVPTPIYPPVRPSQLAEHLTRQAGILRNAGAKLLVTAPEAAGLATLLRLQVETLQGVSTVNELASDVGALPQPAQPGDIALIQYTSGSTGNPKGVTVSHANILANIRAIGEAMQASPSDVFVSWLPLYHDMGLIGAWLGSLYFAAPFVIMSPVAFLVRPERWLWTIYQRRATLSAAPNFAFELCLQKIDDAAIAELDLSSLRMVANGSEAVGAETVRRFAARFARYGFRAEAMARYTGSPKAPWIGAPAARTAAGHRSHQSSVSGHARASGAGVAWRRGRAGIRRLRAAVASARDPHRRADGRAGRTAGGTFKFRGPSATSGYFRNPEKTVELIEGGWLNSGDLAYVAGGDIFITGRTKDIIIRAGRHIYPEEVERAVGEVPGIRRGAWRYLA